MNRLRSAFYVSVGAILLIAALVGCSSSQTSTDQQIQAIQVIRDQLELPDLPLEFIELTGMINSPSGNLGVALYQDDEGRKYFVNPETNQVVEIDARPLLSTISPDAATLSTAEAEGRAMGYIQATINDFETRHSAWQYEEGAKGDHYFFTWYGDIQPGSLNRPFAQIGLHASGMIFAYYNTLLLEE